MPDDDRRISSDNPRTQEVIDDALQDIWSVANELARVRPRHPEAYRVTIFGSARVQPDEPLYQDVKRLACELAERGCDIVTGGGPGLMQAANEGAQQGDPQDRVRSIGVRIALPFEKEPNPFVEQAVTHRTFFTRLHQFVRLSSAFVVVSGGIGTMLEMAMVWQLLQVRHVEVPLILVGPMWKALVDWGREHMIESAPRPFASPEDFSIPICVPTVDEAVAHLQPEIERFRAAQREA